MKLLNKLIISSLVAVAVGMSVPAAADPVPVFDANDEASVNNSNESSISISPPEREVSSRNQVELLTQIQQLQQQVQELQGKLEVQAHDLKVLQDQQRSQYQDLDQRLSKQSPSTKKKVETATAELDKSEVATDTTAATENVGDNTNASADLAKQQKAYQVGYALLKAKKYDQAKTSLQGFIKDYPNSSMTTNARYWLGEIALLQGRPDDAIIEFNKVIKANPSRLKMAEAQLKMGFAYYDKRQWQQARDQLSKVKKQFPGTSAAQLASARLQDIKQQGH